ncbi:glycosyl transferase family 1 [Lamprobacter modestohalophilus]|uniref:Glycosyl transferase family 1 n=1 Tax=Lamprobacter modestohalophilus TaxID=1064514 RepID=A0A9X1B5J5_9GAMM|nr:glycosyltransferase [Lamprobacter modestohalophilus]MBK1619921.1 glycosyl transferase family 1 [Lamprobacter modestohalophilus]
MEHFLWDLLQAQQTSGLSAAALVHHEQPGWHRVTPDAGCALPIYRAPCLGRVLYVPIAPTFPLWLNRAIREFAPNILHLHLPNSSALAALSLPSARRLPWVVHWHADLVASQLDRRLALAYQFYRPFEQRLLRHSRAVIATSPPYLEASEALLPWRDRCTIIPLGLDAARVCAPSAEVMGRVAQHWKPGRLRVLAIGRLTYYKGHEVLLRAIAAMPNAQVLIVGSGDRAPLLSQMISDLGLRDRVQLLGSCSDSEVAALLTSCDLLCLPSLERTEAFGMVLLEAMRFAKPVVVSAIPGSGAGWVVEKADNGLLFPPGDSAALTKALEHLAHAPSLRLRLGQNGALALAREFRIDSIAEAISGVYAEALAEGVR